MTSAIPTPYILKIEKKDPSAKERHIFRRIPGGLEIIRDLKVRDWVARIIGLDEQFDFKREFLKGQIDYIEANDDGTKGVFLWYFLFEGQIYEINCPMTWKSADRYFCKILDGVPTRMTKEEVLKSLGATS